VIKTFKSAMARAAKTLALPTDLPPKRIRWIYCDDLPPALAAGSVTHVVCTCGKHRGRIRGGTAPVEVDDFIEEVIRERERRRRAAREVDEEDYWPFDQGGTLPRDSDFDFPEDSVEQPEEVADRDADDQPETSETDSEDDEGGRSPRDHHEEEIHAALATYSSMSSPGRIDMYMSLIIWDFWFYVGGLSRAGKYSLTLKKVTSLAELFLDSILYHELFHYYCDVQTYLTASSGSPYRNRAKEEPLAVAFSRWRVGEEHRISTHVEAFVEKRFDYSKLPWYRDWRDFLGDAVLAEGLFDYLPYADKKLLKSKGVDVPSLLFGSIEGVIEKPNVALVIWWPSI